MFATISAAVWMIILPTRIPNKREAVVNDNPSPITDHQKNKRNQSLTRKQLHTQFILRSRNHHIKDLAAENINFGSIQSVSIVDPSARH
jgi:hypothetical protein